MSSAYAHLRNFSSDSSGYVPVSSRAYFSSTAEALPTDDQVKELLASTNAPS
ncbi:permease, partial [Mesorhizobium sp. M7A.F.Ca.US.005.03.2.1]